MILTFQFANNSSKSNSAERLADQFNSQPVKKVHQDHNEQRHSEHREENKGETFIYVNPSKDGSSFKLHIQGTATIQILKNSEDLNTVGSRNPVEDKQGKPTTDRFISNVQGTLNEIWAGKNSYMNENEDSQMTNDSDEGAKNHGSATKKTPTLVRDLYNEASNDLAKDESQKLNSNDRVMSFASRYANSHCYRCGNTGHFQGYCREKYHRDGSLIPAPCIKCGKTNHTVENCYSIKDVYGNLLAQ